MTFETLIIVLIVAMLALLILLVILYITEKKGDVIVWDGNGGRVNLNEVNSKEDFEKTISILECVLKMSTKV